MRFHRAIVVCLAAASLTLMGIVPSSGGSEAAAPPVERVAGRSLEEWTGQLKSDDRVVRLRAVKTLPAFGAAAGPALMESLTHGDAALRYWAADGLGTIAPERAAASRKTEADGELSRAVPALRALLEDRHVGVRIAAAFALCRLGEVEHGLPHLTQALEHSERGVANSAADFLARIGPTAKDAIPALEAAAARNERGRPGGDYHIHAAAREALRRIREEPPRDAEPSG